MKKKIYFHKEIIFQFFVSIGFVAILGIDLFKTPFSLLQWGAFLFFFVIFIFSLYSFWFYRHTEKIKIKSIHDINVKFNQEEIIFLDKYFFKESSIYTSKRIYFQIIDQINLNTFPISIVINKNEVIFFPNKYFSELESFGMSNRIPIIDRYEIWAGLNEPFLDTQFTKEELKNIDNHLLQNGIEKKEIKEFRNKIKWTMEIGNSYVWEWIHLGQYDYLTWTFLTKRKYWWSMEIALRNLKIK